MPDISLPNPATPSVDGVPANADNVSADIYFPKAVPESLDVINGRLSNANRDGWDLDRQDVRRGHFSQSKTIAATANQDYFDDFFQDVNIADSSVWQPRAKAIPGCAIAFYIPWDMTAVALSWHVGIIVESGWPFSPAAKYPGRYPQWPVGYYDVGETWLVLYIDGVPVNAIRRKIITGSRSMAFDREDADELWGDFTIPDHRFWSGSFVYDVTLDGTIMPVGTLQFSRKGWHTADIRICYKQASVFVEVNFPDPDVYYYNGVRQARVKTRRMGYTLIR